MRARRSTETSTSGGRSETDMNAFAVMPCTVSPERVVSTVTPVANIPSVRRKAIAGSPVEPLAELQRLGQRGGVERRAERLRRRDRGLDADLELGWPRAFHGWILTGEGRHAPPLSSDRERYATGRAASSSSAAMRASGTAGASSRQCGRSPSWTIRRKRKSTIAMIRTPKPMIFSVVPP